MSSDRLTSCLLCDLWFFSPLAWGGSNSRFMSDHFFSANRVWVFCFGFSCCHGVINDHAGCRCSVQIDLLRLRGLVAIYYLRTEAYKIATLISNRFWPFACAVCGSERKWGFLQATIRPLHFSWVRLWSVESCDQILLQSGYLSASQLPTGNVPEQGHMWTFFPYKRAFRSTKNLLQLWHSLEAYGWHAWRAIQIIIRSLGFYISVVEVNEHFFKNHTATSPSYKDGLFNFACRKSWFYVYSNDVLIFGQSE